MKRFGNTLEALITIGMDATREKRYLEDPCADNADVTVNDEDDGMASVAQHSRPTQRVLALG